MWKGLHNNTEERLKDTWKNYLKYLEEWISDNKDSPTWKAPLAFSEWYRKNYYQKCNMR